MVHKLTELDKQLQRKNNDIKKLTKLIKKCDSLICLLNPIDPFTKDEFIKHFNTYCEYFNCIKSFISEMYEILEENNKFETLCFPDFKHDERVRLRHQNTNEDDPETYWPYVEKFQEWHFIKNNSINLEYSPKIKPRSSEFKDINFSFNRLMYEIKDKNYQNYIKIHLKEDGFTLGTKTKKFPPSSQLNSYLKKDNEIKQKILALSIISPTKNQILDFIEENSCEKRITENIIFNITLDQKIKEVDGHIIAIDKELCNTAFNYAQDIIIDDLQKNG